MAPRRQKRQDDTTGRPLQAPHAHVAEAVGIAAAAGGLVLGTMQAQGAIPDSQRDVLVVQPKEAPSSEHVIEAPLSGQDSSALPNDTPETQPVVEPAAPIDSGLPLATLPVLESADDAAIVARSLPAPLQSQLVSELSEQMTATPVKAMGNVDPGLSPADLGQSLASDIAASAHDIVARLDIDSLLAGKQNLGDTILSQLDPPGIIADVLGATSGIANGVLAQVADMPSSILGETGLAGLGELPSSLLGNEGPEGSGGLLSEVFYADGASDSLGIPVLSEMASTFVGDTGSGPIGLLGLSYTDLSDHQGGHGLNALSLV